MSSKSDRAIGWRQTEARRKSDRLVGHLYKGKVRSAVDLLQFSSRLSGEKERIGNFQDGID